jgi:Tol biopolymer transport system component/DNA-binding winged helix-turn-helix (wHTH) protein
MLNYPRAYEFGPFQLHPAERLLLRAGRPVPLTPKVFETLVILVERHGHLVEKNELMKLLWPNSFVEEGNLTRNISMLRKVLSENKRHPEYIETVSKRGYRFVAIVRESKDPPPAFTVTTALPDIAETAGKSPLLSEPSKSQVPKPTESANQFSSLWSARRVKTGTAVLLVVLLFVAGIGVFVAVRSIRSKASPPNRYSTSIRITRLSNTDKAFSPAISPDGKYVAYVERQDEIQTIWIREVDSSSKKQISAPAEVQYEGLIYSRDGKNIFYTKVEKGRHSGAIYEVSVLGGNERKLADDVWYSPISFAPDGDRLAFVREFPDQSESALMILELSGNKEQRISVRKWPEHFERTAWSPDGRHIVVSARARDGAGPYMYLLALAADSWLEEPSFPQRWVDVRQVAWERDGGGLIITARDQVADVSVAVWELSFPPANAQRITNDLNSYVGLSVATDTDEFATTSFVRNINLWVTTQNNLNQATQLTFGSGRYVGFSWTPDNKVVYASDTSGNFDIWKMNSDGSEPKQLTFEKGVDWYPVVSPDNRYIAFSSDRRGLTNIWRMEVDGANPKVLTSDPLGDRLSFSPDSKWIVYSPTTETGNLWKVPVEGGASEPLTTVGFVRPVVSPDGKLIACNHYDAHSSKWTVAVIPFAGGEPLQTFEFPMNVDGLPPVRWTADGSGLVYINTIHDTSNLWVQPLSSGNPRQLTRLKEGRIYSFDWSRDGKQILLARGSIPSDIVLIKQFR